MTKKNIYILAEKELTRQWKGKLIKPLGKGRGQYSYVFWKFIFFV